MSTVTQTKITKNGPLSWSMNGDVCMISLEGISLSQTTIGNTPRFDHREKEKMIQITIPGKDTRFKDGFLSGNSVIYGVLVNYNSTRNSTIIRISYANNITFSHSINNGGSLIQVKAGNTSTPVSSTTPKPTQTPVPSSTPKPTQTPVSSSTPTPTPSNNVNSANKIGLTFGQSSVSISNSSFSAVKVYRVGNPSRIIVEIAGSADAVEKIMPSGSLYSRAVVTQSSSSIVRVELFTNTMPDWSINESSGTKTLTLTKNDITNIQAGDGNGNIALRLVSTGIVNRYRLNSDSIILDDNVEKGTFAFMIPTSIVNLGDGSAKIEDGLIKSIECFTPATASFIQLNKVDSNTQFKLIEGTSPDELLVVKSTSETNTNNSSSTKLVVLDPGHGGSDPGGVVGSYYEKTYNLDIALRCEAILKAKGINVVLTRITNVFVGFEEIAKFYKNSQQYHAYWI